MKLGMYSILMNRKKRLVITVIALLMVSSNMKAPAQPTALKDPIKTDAGLIAGSTMIGEAGKAVRIYKGIPYAAPPVGDLRWKAPQPVTPWTGVKQVTEFTPWCTQIFPTMKWMGSIPESGMSENCLYLNVLTPAKAASDKLPVMVWIHPEASTQAPEICRCSICPPCLSLE